MRAASAGKALMVVGTTSSAGKSLLVTALCRIFARRGVRVAPFKAQNMSNNAAVCPDGAEIGRAQAVQAAAAGIESTADMNPILLKPEADARSQVVLMGRALGVESARSYHRRKQEFWSVVTAALDRLRANYELVIIEGAGSPVELNLKSRDIVNMAVARYAQSPALLVGDIDRGGVFAQLLGTLWLLEPEERELVKGLVVNKFRGDISLFSDGVRILEERGGVPVLGVVPYLHNLGIPEEDAVALDEPLFNQSREHDVDVAVVKLPLIANFDDFDPLAAEPGVQVRYVSSVQELGRPHAVILPGAKSTIADLAWLQAQGLAEAIRQLAGEGTAVVGICGGYQMLGQVIRDPDHVESPLEEVAGLGLLSLETVFEGEKATHRARARVTGGPGWLADLDGQSIAGYEIHMGRTRGGQPWIEISEQSGEPISVTDGAVSGDGRVWGCYLHGLFENEPLRRAWLSSLGWRGDGGRIASLAGNEAAFDRLADAVKAALDMEQLDAILWGRR
jgi:adenosylcobyric acid synthase